MRPSRHYLLSRGEHSSFAWGPTPTRESSELPPLADASRPLRASRLRPLAWPRALSVAVSFAVAVAMDSPAHGQRGPAQTPLQRLQASIERTTRSVNATWGIWIKS